ncbi:Hypothetical protein, putative [Bodo saltans]|uniref:Uncharacterized protein n=1 Tax=Bodo saltans TaxID=75058 RepID=A0A0S4J6C5_BODSA|nr:Hypothetical protein, putative [Bodo saltans]|eukprot:CUG82098.1 Hypothetical protein, putative [Bodo saltans]
MSLYEGPSLGFPHRGRNFTNEARHPLSAPPLRVNATLASSSGSGFSRHLVHQRSTSPSPELLVDALTNSSLANAALHSTNPYLRAGVFAVANNRAASAASSARRSVSNSVHNEAPVSYPTRRNVSLSRSRSPSTGAAASMPHQSPRSSHGTSKAASSAMMRTQQQPTSTRELPRANRSSPAWSSDIQQRRRHHHYDASEYSDAGSDAGDEQPLEESNVWVTEGTFIEDIASPPRHLRQQHPVNRRSHLAKQTPQQRQVSGYYFSQHGDPLQSSSDEIDKMIEAKLSIPPPTSSDVFVELMQSFSARFGSIRASTQQYVPSALAKLPVHKNLSKAPVARESNNRNNSFILDDEDDDVSTPLQRLELELGGGRPSRAQQPSAIIAPVVMSFAASPEQRRVGGSSALSFPSATFGHVTSQYTTSESHNYYDDAVVDAEAPMLHVSEQLLQLTFTCNHCGAKHMRGLQCSRCQRQLPRLCRCARCASWMRGNFCSTCGCRQPSTDTQLES